MELVAPPSGSDTSAEPSPDDLQPCRITEVLDAPPDPQEPAQAPETAASAIAGVAELRRHFQDNRRLICFISATSFNLLGIDADVGCFGFINYIDSFDGRHPHVSAPREQLHAPFASIEDINNYLLQHDAVRERLTAGPDAARLVFLMFDEKSEALARALGASVLLPPASLRGRVDSKIETVRLGERAGVPSVPGTLAEVTSYAQLCRLADGHGLGRDLVVQAAYGDSGRTTYFIRDEADFVRQADAIVGKGEVKIMRRIRCLGTAIEGCVTRRGIVAGPLMTELIGFPELTPYRGGWCGNEVFPDAFTPELRERARDYTLALGEQLRAEGYRGCFELDLLLDLDTGELWLGELNPRVTGASPMTTHATRATAGVSLFLLHLLEYEGVDLDVDLDALTAAWTDPIGFAAWSQMAIRHTGSAVELVRAAPRSGVYRLVDGSVVFDRFERDHRAVRGDDEAFFLRILKEGDHLYEGADLGILLLPGRSMDADHTLTARAQRWIAGIRGLFAARPASRDQHREALARLIEDAPAVLYQLSYEKEAADLHDAALAAIDCLPDAARASYIAELRRGWLLYQLGRNAEASAAYARATALAPAAVEPRLGRMLPLIAEQRYVAALALGREILAVDPHNYLASLRLAFIRYAQGDHAAAAADYAALLAAYPGDIEVMVGLGWALLKLGRADEAVARFRDVLAVAPRHQAAREGFLAQSDHPA